MKQRCVSDPFNHPTIKSANNRSRVLKMAAAFTHSSAARFLPFGALRRCAATFGNSPNPQSSSQLPGVLESHFRPSLRPTNTNGQDLTDDVILLFVKNKYINVQCKICREHRGCLAQKGSLQEWMSPRLRRTRLGVRPLSVSMECAGGALLMPAGLAGR
jgi:hypothetical protein